MASYYVNGIIFSIKADFHGKLVICANKLNSISMQGIRNGQRVNYNETVTANKQVIQNVSLMMGEDVQRQRIKNVIDLYNNFWAINKDNVENEYLQKAVKQCDVFCTKTFFEQQGMQTMPDMKRDDFYSENELPSEYNDFYQECHKPKSKTYQPYYNYYSRNLIRFMAGVFFLEPLNNLFLERVGKNEATQSFYNYQTKFREVNEAMIQLMQNVSFAKQSVQQVAQVIYDNLKPIFDSYVASGYAMLDDQDANSMYY